MLATIQLQPQRVLPVALPQPNAPTAQILQPVVSAAAVIFQLILAPAYLVPTLQTVTYVIRAHKLVFLAIAGITWQILAPVYPAQLLATVRPAINLKMLV